MFSTFYGGILKTLLFLVTSSLKDNSHCCAGLQKRGWTIQNFVEEEARERKMLRWVSPLTYPQNSHTDTDKPQYPYYSHTENQAHIHTVTCWQMLMMRSRQMYGESWSDSRRFKRQPRTEEIFPICTGGPSFPRYIISSVTTLMKNMVRNENGVNSLTLIPFVYL